MRGGREKRKEEWVMWRFVPLDSLPSKAASHGGRHERTFARRGRRGQQSTFDGKHTVVFTMTSL